MLLDLGGADFYSQRQTNNSVWLKPLYGVGLDTEIGKRNEPVGRGSLLAPRVVFGADRALGGDRQVSWRRSGDLRSDQLRTTETGATRQQGRLYRRPWVDPHQPIEWLLRRALRDTDTAAHGQDAEAAWAELKKRGVEALSYLVNRVDSPDVLVRVKVEELVDSLGTNSVPSLIHGLDTARNEEMARVRSLFSRAVESATNAIPHVLPLLAADKTRGIALYTLGHLRARAAFHSALAALHDPQELVRLRAAQALGRIGDRRATPRLVRALADESWTVRYAAEAALVGFGSSSLIPLSAGI